MEINNLEDLGVDEAIILNKFSIRGMGARTGFLWLWIGTGGGLL